MSSDAVTSIATSRLTLIAATEAHVRAELEDQRGFAAMLDAVVPTSWPPGEYDADAQRFFLQCLVDGGEAVVGWLGWYGIARAGQGGRATLVGSAGYFGPPTTDGVVEIGYSVCPEYRGVGFASEMATALTVHALTRSGVREVIAHTLATNPASAGVLRRSGFRVVGPRADDGAMRHAFPG